MNAPDKLAHLAKAQLADDEISLSKRIPAMESGFTIMTAEGEFGFTSDDDIGDIIDAVREALEARIKANAVIIPGEFITVPETTLSSGLVVPAFQVAKYHTTRREDGTPWVEVNYHKARAASESAGLHLITETQWLAIAHNIAQQDINWTGGKVGEGKLFQGMRKYNVREVQPQSYEPADADERRWHELSNGERIYDFAGHLYSWVFDDVQGDENGLIAKAFEADSPSLTTAPAKSMENGVGWMPDAGANASGYALCRGGYFDSCDFAGVFRLNFGWPDYENGFIGFRCTKSL